MQTLRLLGNTTADLTATPFLLPLDVPVTDTSRRSHNSYDLTDMKDFRPIFVHMIDHPQKGDLDALS